MPDRDKTSENAMSARNPPRISLPKSWNKQDCGPITSAGLPAVPEPSTPVLAGFGLLAMVAMYQCRAVNRADTR